MNAPDAASNDTPKYTNALIDETSPYLLQHAHNPVDWLPWGEAAFARAKAEDKPIFLSIGYSTCHWCHVMEHESFEDEVVAEYLRENFISVKVDREERPDVDSIYMTALQMVSGGGGWPMSLMLDHERRPFFLGTYLPPADRFGRPGFMTVLQRVNSLWRERREDILHDAQKITGFLNETPKRVLNQTLDQTTLERSFGSLSRSFDVQNGGFGTRPKFPTPHVLNFLQRMRDHEIDGVERINAMVDLTLRKMAQGGIHDHVGGGFHRYATDAHWHLPHFEKMLYDQAQLAIAYLEAYQVSHDHFFADVARDIFKYVERDLRDPDGGFWSAEDADSLNLEGHKEEGAFYTFSIDDLKNVLGEDDAALIATLYGFTEEGNFQDESSGQRNGTNILHLGLNLPEDGRENLPLNSREEYQAKVHPLLEKLRVFRDGRERPHCDDKVLCSWNGLMIGALALGARTLGDAKYLELAQKAADFILAKMRNDDGGLLHSYRAGQAKVEGFLDDYAFLSRGLLDLYESCFDARYLQSAIDLCEYTLMHFEDLDGGGFYFARAGSNDLIARRKEIYDGAEPSGNAVLAEVLMRIAMLTGNSRYDDAAQGVFDAFAHDVKGRGAGHTQLMVALDLSLQGGREVVVAVPEGADDSEWLAALWTRFAPRTQVIVRRDADLPTLEKYLPFTVAQEPIDGAITAYVCTNRACTAPATDLAAFLQQLDA